MTTLLHTNTCKFCRRPFLTNAIAVPHCPRCAKLRRALRARDARRARLVGLRRVWGNVKYDLRNPLVALVDRRKGLA